MVTMLSLAIFFYHGIEKYTSEHPSPFAKREVTPKLRKVRVRQEAVLTGNVNKKARKAEGRKEGITPFEHKL
jgi:hypothetical protein